MQRFIVVSRHIAAGALPRAWGGKYRRQPSQQPMTLPPAQLVFVAFEDVIPTIITTMNAKRLAISSTRSAIRGRNRNHKTIYCIGDAKRGLGWVKAAEQTVAPAQQL
jgi:hypothetical protein